MRKSSSPPKVKEAKRKRTDPRKLTREAKEALRERAVLMVRDEGVSVVTTARLLGVSKVSIHAWLNSYDAGGIAALKVKSAPGRARMLTSKQEHRLFQILRKKTPLAFGFKSMLWTRELVAKVIKKLFGVSFVLQTISRVLARLSITFQKPIRRAYQCDPVAVKKWQEETLPEIEALASDARASLYYGDECSVRSDHLSGKTWAPKGETPVVVTTGTRCSVNVISAMSKRGDLRFALFDGKMTGDLFCKFLDRLMKGRRRPVYLILDNSRIHTCRVVREHVASYNGKLKIFFSRVIRLISTRTSVFGQT
jgi:transposase